MNEKLTKEVRFLRYYSFILTITMLILFFLLNNSSGEDFEEINVERINIVEKDGQLRMVISNKDRQHPGIANGEIIKRDYPRPPGMIFFNHVGDEMGGFVFDANGKNSHFGQLTFDKFRNDQSIGFRYLESDNGSYMTGLEIWQQPNFPVQQMNAKIDSVRAIENEDLRNKAYEELQERNEITTRRLFLGKYRNNSTSLTMADMAGNPRIRMYVTADGESKLEFLDKSGEIVYSLPQ